jgi:hypothetical protein
MMKSPSAARNEPITPARRPLTVVPSDHICAYMSLIAIIESSIATSTRSPVPVWSRRRSAASTPTAAKIAVATSPSAPAMFVFSRASGSRPIS